MFTPIENNSSKFNTSSLMVNTPLKTLVHDLHDIKKRENNFLSLKIVLP